MSTRTLLRLTSLACILGVAACEESDGRRDDDDPSSFDGEDDDGDGTDDDDDSPPADGGTRPSTGRDAGGATASAPSARFFLPTGEPTNTAAPVLEVDTVGNTHLVYPAYAGGNAFYGFCAAGTCKDGDDVAMVQFATEGAVGDAMLALTRDGKPRVLLATSQQVYFGSCDARCSDEASWSFGPIMKLDELAVTGEAFALDPQGKPRFLVHGYRNQFYPLTPRRAETLLAACDSNCNQAVSWTSSKIADKEIWQGSSLRYDARGGAHVATFVYAYGENAGPAISAYLSCASNCSAEGSFKGIGFLAPYESSTEAVGMNPAISLALTKSGAPRIAQIVKTPEGKKRIAYFACDTSCQSDAGWTGGGIFEADAIHAGIDLALDADDRPRIAHTMNYDIVLTYCDEATCTGENSSWESTYVEKGAEIPADDIFLEWNCTIGSWFLHSPSIALASDGKPRVGYQSRDVSGGFSQADINKPRCVAGTDMTWSRLGLMTNYK